MPTLYSPCHTHFNNFVDATFFLIIYLGGWQIIMDKTNCKAPEKYCSVECNPVTGYILIMLLNDFTWDSITYNCVEMLLQHDKWAKRRISKFAQPSNVYEKKDRHIHIFSNPTVINGLFSTYNNLWVMNKNNFSISRNKHKTFMHDKTYDVNGGL